MPVLRGIGQLVTCPPSGGQAELGVIHNAALAHSAGQVVWVGQEAGLPEEYQNQPSMDLGGALVIPGLIDCHTHLCFGGWRGDEFEMRIQGRSYQEIAAAGGGIRSTVAATRAASHEELRAKAATALAGMLSLGVTTVECKSGYGLNLEHELKQLRVYQTLQKQQAVELVPTFLGAHIVPPEYAERRQDYVDLICQQMLPQVVEQGLARFCDIYIDTGAYTLAEGEQILQRARDLGLGLKAHAEQLSYTGAAVMAATLGAVSVEHLEYLEPADLSTLARCGTTAVTLPFASLYLRERYTNARSFIDAGVGVAVASDFNPGSSPSWHLPLALTLACLNQQMTPAEALKGATHYAARAIAASDRIGSLLPGFQADLAIIDAPSVNHWLYHFQPNPCTGVMKCGQWVHSATIR